MGISFNGHAGAIDWIQSRFKKSKPATLYFDEIRTPTYTDCLNELCEVVLGSELSGLYHAGGPRRLSLFNIAQVINRVGGYDPKLLMGCPRRLAGPIPPRAAMYRSTQVSSPRLLATTRSIPGRWPRSSSPRIPSGTSSATVFAAPNTCWPKCCTETLRKRPTVNS